MVKRLAILSAIIVVLAVLVSAFAGGVTVKADKPDRPPGQEKKGGGNGNGYPETIYLADIDSHLTSPTGKFRWLDVADQAYSSSYRDSYDYTKATVKVSFAPAGEILKGIITARNLKPNFAYQIKLAGYPEAYPVANECIGLAGRWWQEEWNGSEWTNGKILTTRETAHRQIRTIRSTSQGAI